MFESCHIQHNTTYPLLLEIFGIILQGEILTGIGGEDTFSTAHLGSLYLGMAAATTDSTCRKQASYRSDLVYKENMEYCMA